MPDQLENPLPPLPDSDLGPGAWVLAQRRNAVSAALEGLDGNPDEAAQALKLGETSNVPAPLAGIDLEGYQRQQKAALVASMLEHNEQLRNYALGHPLAAKVSADDWGQLDTVSGKLDRLHSGPFHAPVAALEAAAQGFKEGMEQPGEHAAAAAQAGYSRLLTALAGVIDFPSQVFGGATEAIRRGSEAFQVAMGADPNAAAQRARELAAVFEAEAGGLSGRHPVGEPPAEAVAAIRAARPFLEEGKVPPVGVHPEIDNLHVEQAKLDAKNLDELFSESQKSATRERAPDLFSSFIRQHTDASIGIDAEAVRKLYGDKVPAPDDGLLGWVEGIQDQLGLAEHTGGDIEVPLADWLAKADPEVAKELHDSIRVRPGGVTLEEAKELPREAPETISSAALRNPQTNEVLTDITHGQAFAKAAEQGAAGNFTDYGFVTSSGRFVDREEALQIAGQAKQIRKESSLANKDLLTAEQITPAPEITPVDSIRRAAKLEDPAFVATDFGKGIIPDTAEPAAIRAEEAGVQATTFKAKDAIQKIDPEGLTGVPRALHEFFSDRLEELAGDTNVWVVRPSEMKEINKALGLKRETPGFYHSTQHAIVLREDVAAGAYGHAAAAHLLMHETAHAATMRAMKQFPELNDAVQSLMDETERLWSERLAQGRVQHDYAFKNVDEFMAEAFSNPEFQEKLSVTPISNELANKLGLHAKQSLWDAVKNIVKQLLTKLVGREVPDTILDGLMHLGPAFEEANARIKAKGEGVAAAPPLEPELPGITRVEDRNLFENARAIGMSQKRLKNVMALIEKRRAEDAAHQEGIAQKRAAEQQTKEWKENYAGVREQARKDVRSRPDIAADLLFRNGELYGDKVPRPKLDSRQLTPEQRAAIPKEYVGEGGIHPDDAAGLFGYQSGDSLVEGLARLHAEREREGLTPAAHLTRLGDVEAERVMRRDYGSLEQNILEEAKDHVISETQLDLLHEYMLALAEHAKAELPLGKDDIKQWVKDQFNRLSVGAHSTDKYLAQSGRAGQDIIDALAEGRPKDALKAQQDQYVNLLLANEAKRLEKERAQFEKTAKRFSRREVSGLPAEYTNWVHDILQRTGNIVRRSVQDLQDAISRESADSLEKFVSSKNADARIWEADENMPSDFQRMPVASFLFDPSYRKPIGEMSVDEFRAVNNSIKTLIKNGRDENKVLVGGEKADLKETVDKMVGKIEELSGGKKNVPIPGNKQGFGHAIRTYFASLLQVESIFNRFDRGDPKGIFFKTFIEPFFQASNGLAAKEREYSRLYAQLKFDRREMKKKVDNSLFIDPLTGDPMEMNRGHLMAVLQNIGNPSQLDKLARGYKIADPQAILRWVMANTTKEDWDRAQALGDIFEKAFGESATMYHSLSGVSPEKIDIRSIQTPFGEYRGWYHPIIYDPDRPGTSKKLMGPGVLEDGSYYRAATPSGYTKKRTSYAAPILLSMDLVPAKLRAILNDTAMRPAVSEASKIFYDPRWQMSITKAYGKEVKDLMIPYLKDIAGQKQYKDAAQSTALRVLEKARQNVIATLIGLRPSTVMKHGPTAAMLSMNEVGYLPFLRELKGLLSFNDELGEKNWNFAMRGGEINGEHWGGSEELQRRHRNWQETLTGAQADVFGENTLRNSVIKFGATPVALSDLISAVPTWLAAYKNQIRAGETHGAAVSFADRAVRRAHGSSAVTARPRIMRGGPLAQFATPFYTFFNEMFQRQYEIAWRAKDMLGQFSEGEYRAGAKQLPYLTSGLWTYVIFPALVEQMVSPVLTGNQSETTKVLGWGARTVGSSLPVVRDLIESFLSGHDPSVGLYSTALQSLAELGRDVSRKNISFDNAHAGKTIRHAITTFGMLTGLTNEQEGRTGEFIYDYVTGRQKPKTNGDVLRGLWHGQMKEQRR